VTHVPPVGAFDGAVLIVMGVVLVLAYMPIARRSWPITGEQIRHLKWRGVAVAIGVFLMAIGARILVLVYLNR
jgi:hypothetical protein